MAASESSARTTSSALIAQLSPPLAALGLTVEDVTVVPAGSRRLLRVLVDRDVSGCTDDTSPVAPLSLDEVADATRVVSDTLDDSGAMGERPYTLEVSSSGVGRPLHGYAGLRRNVGRLVTLETRSEPGRQGRVRAVSADTLTLETPATKTTPAARHDIPLTDVVSARVEVEFGRVDAPGDNAHTDEES